MYHRTPQPANPANVPSARFFANIGLSANMRVLDVGCGNGDLSRLIAALLGPDGEVVGIDSSEAALASGLSFSQNSAHAPIRYEAADLSTNLADMGQFDAIVGRRVLMYLPEAAATLAQLARLAKPGAILAFQEHARAPLPAGAGNLLVHRQCYDLMWNTVAAERGDVTLGYRLADLVRAAGFAIEEERSEGILIPSWAESFLPTLMNVMLPRMVEKGLVQADEVDLEDLAQRIDDERRAAQGTVFWDLAFLVAGRRI